MSPHTTQPVASDARGWRVVGVAFALAVFAWGIGFYGPSILLQALHRAHGWSISTISLAITAHFLLSAAMVAYLPEAHRRFGLANVTLAGVAFTALGILAWANALSPWHLFLAVPFSSAGWAATSGAAINAIVSPWFDRERPKALSMAFNGASIGGVVFAPVLSLLVFRLGLPSAACTVAVVMLAIMWPLVFRLVRVRPAPAPMRANSPEAVAQRPALSRRALLNDRRFVSISGAFALALFAQVGLFAHLITRLGPVLGDAGAAWALSMTAAAAIAGRTLLGWVIGHRSRRHAASANFLLQAIGVVLLALATHPVPTLAGCLLFGLGVGNMISLPPLIAQHEFASEDVATVVALITAINQAVFAFAPAIFGLLRDFTGSYAVAFALGACAQVVAAVIVSRERR